MLFDKIKDRLKTTDKVKPLVWSNAFSIGYPLVDGHHKKLFGITKKLYSIIYGDSKNQIKNIEKIAVELRNYTVYHFSAEEEIMQHYKCPLYLKHKEEHDLFIQAIEDSFNDLIHGDITARREIYKFLVNWLVKHVTGSDKQWADWIKENK